MNTEKDWAEASTTALSNTLLDQRGFRKGVIQGELMALIPGSNVDGLTDDENSVSQDSDTMDTNARDLKGTARFLRANNPNSFGGVFESDGSPAPHSPALQIHEGAPKAGQVSEDFKSTSKDAKARRARNKADLRKKQIRLSKRGSAIPIVDTTYHPGE